MSSDPLPDNGPDLTKGVTLADFGDRALLRGHVGEEAVALARVGEEVLAIGASCTHYGGPLDEGAIVGDTVRCPWHHACFSLRTGEALEAPAFDPVPCWQVIRSGDRFVVGARAAPAARPAAPQAAQPDSIVIVGGGAAGFACAEMLRRRGYQGRVTMLSEDADAPCDRPNLSKDYLAGNAPEEWMPLRPGDFYAQNHIDLRLDTRAKSIDVAGRTVTTGDGRVLTFDRLLLATGAEPVRLPIPGADQGHVFTLRSFADTRAIIARAKTARSAVVLGSGFIGLEVAAALRERGLAVDVVSLDKRPLERVLGAGLGDFVRGVHESHGVTFHMERSIGSIGADKVALSDGREVAADLVILGVGVRPRIALAQETGLDTDHGVLVDAFLETSAHGIYAAGDIARWRDRESGEMRRVEHWVVAERQGQVAAANMLGARDPFVDVPFFWSAHYDMTIRYVGHALAWDAIEVDGDIAARDCLVRYMKDGKVIAAAAIGRDAEALRVAEMLARPAH